MHSVADVFSLIDGSVASLHPEAIPLADSLGTVLGRTVYADADQPAFDRSAIDGYAVLSGSGPGEFRLGDEVLPGNPVPLCPKRGEAQRIFTGGAVPAGCGLVMIEDSVAASNGNEFVFLNKAADEMLVRKRGSSIEAGTALLPPGTEIGPGEIALLASLGESRPLVHPAPRVLHLITGREIVAPEARPEPGQIRDSNGPMIRALLADAGFRSVSQIRIDESVESLRDAVESAGPFDLLLVSGGSSVGKYDRTRTGLETLGFSIPVERVNSRPGKPMILARRGDQWAFGLPGNPVAHFAVFHVFVKRLLRTLAKKRPVDHLNARLNADTPASSDPRESFWPARLTQTDTIVEAAPMRWVDSGDLAALRGVNALIHFPETTRGAAGDRVSVVPCSPFPVSETRLDPRGDCGLL